MHFPFAIPAFGQEAMSQLRPEPARGISGIPACPLDLPNGASYNCACRWERIA